MQGLKEAKEYLDSIGFEENQLPVLFNEDDKSYYTIAELLESFYNHKKEQSINQEKQKIWKIK